MNFHSQVIPHKKYTFNATFLKGSFTLANMTFRNALILKIYRGTYLHENVFNYLYMP